MSGRQGRISGTPGNMFNLLCPAARRAGCSLRTAALDASAPPGWPREAPRSHLGYPVTDEIGGLVAGGAKQIFQRGQVIWSPSAGARILTGGIETAWAGQGWERGRLGYPTTNEYAVSGGGYAQDFQGGRITWRSGGITVDYAGGTATADPAPPRVPVTPPPAPTAPTTVYYKNCSAVRAAGKAPLYRWQPGYRTPLDADNDGIACEWTG